jgi:hypothetical protein
LWERSKVRGSLKIALILHASLRASSSLLPLREKKKIGYAY